MPASDLLLPNAASPLLPSRSPIDISTADAADVNPNSGFKDAMAQQQRARPEREAPAARKREDSSASSAPEGRSGAAHEDKSSQTASADTSSDRDVSADKKHGTEAESGEHGHRDTASTTSESAPVSEDLAGDAEAALGDAALALTENPALRALGLAGRQPLHSEGDSVTEELRALAPVTLDTNGAPEAFRPLASELSAALVRPAVVSGTGAVQESVLTSVTELEWNAGLRDSTTVAPSARTTLESSAASASQSAAPVAPMGNLTAAKPVMADVVANPQVLPVSGDTASTSSVTATSPIPVSAQVSLTQPGMAANEATGRFSVSVQFGRAEWAAGVANQVAQMVSQKLNFAEIQLDPPELGPLQVRVQVTQDQATVAFTAANAQVKEALEQTNQRLREMLEQEGLNLVDVDVRDQQQQQGEDALESEASSETSLANEQDEEDVTTEETVLRTSTRMGVDELV